MKRVPLRKPAIAALSGLLLYTLGGFFLVPWVAKGQLQKRLPELLRREVTLEQVRFNPFTLTGRLQGLRVLDTDGETFLSCTEALADFQSFSLLQKGYSFREVRLVEPYIRVLRQADQSLNFQDLLPAPEETNPTGEDAALPVLRIRQLLVESGRLAFADAFPGSPFSKEVRDISFSVENLSTEPESSGVIAFEAASGSAERFSWTGQLSLVPFSLSGSMGVESLELPDFMPYVEHLFAGKVESGRLSIRLDYAVRPEPKGLDLVVSNGSLVLDAFSLRTHDAEEALLRWHSLRAEGGSLDLLSGQVRVNSLSLEGASVFVHRHPEGEVNVFKAYQARELASSANAEPASPSAFLPEAWDLRVEAIRATDTALRFLDEQLEIPSDLTLVVPQVELLGLTNVPGESFDLNLQARDTRGGEASLTGSASLVPLGLDLKLEAADWDLTVADPYVQEFAHVGLLSGKLGLNGSLAARLDPAAPQEFRIAGEAAITDFKSRELQAGAPLTSWSLFSLKGMEFALPGNTLSIASIEYQNPSFGVVIQPDGTLNAAEIIKTRDIRETVEALETEAAAESAARPGGFNPQDLAVTVDSFTITNGTFRFEDRQQSPSVVLVNEAIKASATGISSDPSARPELAMEMLVMGITPLKVTGTVNLLADTPSADLDIQLRSLELTPLAPYFARYVGFILEKGLLNLDLQYQIDYPALRAENAVVLNQFTLGSSTGSPDAPGLPVPLAVSLLKDPAGNIEVKVPVRGDLTDPEFRIGGVILKAFANLILKAATSPFSLLANLAGASAEDLQTVAFAPGYSDLSEEARSNLAALATALQERPGISLELSAAVDPEWESPALAMARLRTHLRETFPLADQPDLPEPEAHQIRVEKAWRRAQPLAQAILPGELPPLPEMEAELLEAFPVNPNDLNQLALQRKQVVREFLVSAMEIAPERVLLLETPPQGDPAGTSEVRLSIR